MSKRSIGLIINLIMLGIAAVLYPRMPEVVPTHWDFHGRVTDTMPKMPGAFLPSLIALLIWLLLPLLRRIDPRRASYEKFDATFYLIINLICVMMALLQGLLLAVGSGVHIDMVRSMMLGIGIMLIVLGNYMPRLRSNWWMGIRTPWTLDNQEVWRRTHRVGGRLFVIAGVVIALSTLLPGEASSTIAIAAMAGAALIPVIYSYVVWRTEPSRRTPEA